jgi:hypothetical protein
LIEHLTIRGFKSFERVELDLGALNFFVGTNSSGKSNLFDALRILQGIGYGLSVDEIFNGKPKSGNGEAWEPIRGGSANAGLLKWDEAKQTYQPHVVSIEVRVSSLGRTFTYSITMSPRKGIVLRERLASGSGDIFAASSDITNRRNLTVRYGHLPDRPMTQSPSTPLLSHLHLASTEEQDEQMQAVLDLLSNSQHLDPSPHILRAYSLTREVKRLGERGENFAALVKSILADEKTADAYLSWLRKLTPRDLDNIVILNGALGEPMFALEHRGKRFPAPVLSDGTLRFAALTAAFFQPDMPHLLILEEIENGIHPSRLRLLVELLKSRTSESGTQVMASTHSPVIIDWLNEEDMKHCFLCRHDESTGISSVQPLSTLPRLTEIMKRKPAGELFVEGWMENSA